MENKKVLIGMSGGVDSSVAAVLLKEQGYEVIGATLELFAGSSCCNLDTYIGAKSVCKSIGIPHFTYDYKKEFKEHVINDFIYCYENSLTPNPCIECNKFLKFGLMVEKAKELGCNYIATGHYAKTFYSEEYKRWVLAKSNAGKKDQSYVLWNMPKELVEHILFPLADFSTKEEIRKIAKDHNLNVASKPDSEDICFIPDGDYKKFLENNSNIKPKVGNIVTRDGRILGKHNGLYNYTIGQRKGLGISNPVPLFVIGFNKEKNEVIVGEENELYTQEFLVKDVNLLLVDDVEKDIEVDVKIRYSSPLTKAILSKITENDIVKYNMKNEDIRNILKVSLKEPQKAVTPGQSAVFYIGDIVLGGGKII